ncbi:hypothetical protein Bhyg_16647 [Pseudolycoriella hygida]|uniref:Uncharacterized protein n=1 Tax=Pseudolycoriella hygida TaxID=35572 RepID=A0A9Q0MKC1_9DIPT|nr:hypothetical protein Bhyg_16647 [Pseudolycoriella hygida]
MTSQILSDLSGLMPIGEKRKILNQFVRNAEDSQVNNILDDCKVLPSTQYNLLKLSLADKFQRLDLIIELLFDSDSSIVNCATSLPWLYEGDNNSFIECDFLINKLFPNVSYSCRQKVLHRIGRHVKNEKKADEIWDAVDQKYGFHLAFTLLQACSESKLDSILTSKKVTLSGYQMVQILEKHYDVGLKYLKDRVGNVSFSSTNSYRSPMAFLYKHHPVDFLDLCLSDKYTYKLGRGRSKKIIRAFRDKLLQNPTEAIKILKRDRIRREFNMDEFQMFCESTLQKVSPDSVNSEDLWKWVNMVPKNKRVDMVNEMYKKLFQFDLDERKECMSASYIILLPDEQRLSVVQWKIENDKNNGWSYKDIYVYCYSDDEKKRAWTLLKPSSHSVPELKKLLLIEQDVSKRAYLSDYLIKACYLNEDHPQLLNVLLLLSKRSRNDQTTVRITIFQSLRSIMEKMEFSKQHWDVIIEMIQVALVMTDSRDYSDGDKEKLIEKCIMFHLASDLPLNNLIPMLIKLKIQTGSSTWNNPYIKNEGDRRKLLELYVKELENLQLADNLRSHDGETMDSDELSQFVTNLIEVICEFNKKARKSTVKLEPILIASHQWLRTSLEKIAKEEEDRIKKNYKNNTSFSWNFAEKLVNIIKELKKEEDISLDAFNESDGLFSIILLSSPCTSILKYFFAKNPSKLVENWSTTIAKMLKNESGEGFMRELKTWNYSTLIAEAIKTCSEIIDQTVDNDARVSITQKCNAVSALSILSDPLDFLSLVEKFYPEADKVDVFADNSKEEYQIRQVIAKSIVKVKVSHLALPAVEKFSVGDYLKLTVGALYSHSVRASQKEAMKFLHQKLNNSPVSLHKHIIRLYFTISSVEEKIRALGEIKSSNVSIRYELFLRANHLLRSSPSLQTWTLLKEILEKTTEEDSSIILYLHMKPKLDTCPKEYIADYIISCLDVLTKLKAETVHTFLNHVYAVMDVLSEEALEDIVMHKNNGNAFYSSFYIPYLENSSTESIADRRLTNIWILLENKIQTSWDVKKPAQYYENKFEYPTRSSIHEFISTLTEVGMADASKAWIKQKNLQFLIEKFSALSVKKFFKEILFLNFGLLIVKDMQKSSGERLRAFGQGLASLTDSLVKKYGGEIVLIIKNAITEYESSGVFCNETNVTNGIMIELIDGILETSKSTANQIISYGLLQNVNPKASNLVATLERVEKVLNEALDDVAEMYFESITR